MIYSPQLASRMWNFDVTANFNNFASLTVDRHTETVGSVRSMFSLHVKIQLGKPFVGENGCNVFNKINTGPDINIGKLFNKS